MLSPAPDAAPGFALTLGFRVLGLLVVFFIDSNYNTCAMILQLDFKKKKTRAFITSYYSYKNTTLADSDISFSLSAR